VISVRKGEIRISVNYARGISNENENRKDEILALLRFDPPFREGASERQAMKIRHGRPPKKIVFRSEFEANRGKSESLRTDLHLFDIQSSTTIEQFPT